MSREVCGICWCPYDEDTGECACAPQGPTPPPEAQTEAEKIAYCAGWWDALAKARKAEQTVPSDCADSHQPLTIERLRDALVASRIIPPAAVEDPDEYDDGVTLFRIKALHRRIT